MDEASAAAAPRGLTGTAKLALALIVILLVVGAFWHGISLESLKRSWRDLFERPSGPMAFRFILQPVMAAIAAFKDGMTDARTGRSPYFWTILNDPQKRTRRLNEALVATSRIIVIGLVVDAIYQLRVFKTFYPGEAVNIALLLAFVPYLLLRGPIARIVRRRIRHKPSGSPAS